jgi:hypothetical protein
MNDALPQMSADGALIPTSDADAGEPKVRFIIEVRAFRDDVPPLQRLKRALKYMGRVCNLGVTHMITRCEHRPGAPLFRYRQGTRKAAQSPATRPPTEFEEVGYECCDCGEKVLR